MAGNGFEVRRLSGSLGAEILGIDLSAAPGHNTIAAIRQVWLDHGVIFFRDQDLPPAKFLAFAKQFGEVVEYPFIKGIEGFPGDHSGGQAASTRSTISAASGTATRPISKRRRWAPC